MENIDDSAKTTDYLPSIRVLAAISLIILLPSLLMFGIESPMGAYAREYVGLLWHVSMFFFVAKLPAPAWARTAGFAWIVLDVLCGVLFINHVPYQIAWNVRMAAHIFEGIWLMGSALTVSSRLLKGLALVGGALLFAYTWVSPFLPVVYLAANVPLLLMWLILIAIKGYPVDHRPSTDLTLS